MALWDTLGTALSAISSDVFTGACSLFIALLQPAPTMGSTNTLAATIRANLCAAAPRPSIVLSCRFAWQSSLTFFINGPLFSGCTARVASAPKQRRRLAYHVIQTSGIQMHIFPQRRDASV